MGDFFDIAQSLSNEFQLEYFKLFLRSILDALEHSPCRTPQSSFNMSGRFYTSRKHPNVLRREPPARGVAVVYSVLNRVRFGYGNYSLFRDAPVERHLGFGFADFRRHSAQGSARIFFSDVINAAVKRTVGYYANVFLPTITQEAEFYPPIHQTIAYLV
jgi:hypothetical protein